MAYEKLHFIYTTIVSIKKFNKNIKICSDIVSFPTFTNYFCKSVIYNSNQSMKKKKNINKTEKQLLRSIENKCIQRMIALTRKDYLMESLDVAPLKEGDRLFNESNDISDSCFNRSKDNNEVVMPEAYINTALWLLDLIKLSDNNLVKDGYIFPALYCFRHYLELIMKDSIHYFKENRGEISSEELGYEGKHGLLELWKLLKVYLHSDCEVNMIGQLIKELQELDKGSTRYRYPFDYDYKNTIIIEYTNSSMMINVSELKNRMLQLYRFFEGVNFLARECSEVDTY